MDLQSVDQTSSASLINDEEHVKYLMARFGRRQALRYLKDLEYLYRSANSHNIKRMYERAKINFK